MWFLQQIQTEAVQTSMPHDEALNLWKLAIDVKGKAQCMLVMPRGFLHSQ